MEDLTGGIASDLPGNPAFAPGCRAHVVPHEQVLILGGRQPTVLHGRAHSLVAPLIDGRTTDAEIVAALADRLPASVVQLALVRLTQRGLLVRVEPGPVPESAPPPSADALAGFVAPGAGELRCLSIGVPNRIGLRVAHAVSARSLDAATRGLTVLVVDDYLRDELDEIAARCRADDTALLPIRIRGVEWWLGPFCDGAAAAPMWRLLGRRLRANRAADVDALRRGATFPLYGDVAMPDATVEAGIAHAASVIDRTLAGTPPEDVVDRVLVRDHQAAGSTEHEIAIVTPDRAPRTPGFDENLPPVRLAAGPRREGTEGGHRVCPPEATLARLAPLISPITGIVAGLERVPALEGTHVYATAGTLDWPDGSCAPPVFRRGALGKGQTDAQARASCMGEAVELVSSRFTGDEMRRRARWRDVEEIAIHPRALLLFSDHQYAEVAGRTEAPAWDGVPAPLDERHAIEWVPLVSLVSGRTRWLPAAACFFGYADPEYPAPDYATANANGCAAGNTLEEAILQALLELIERDACALWWYNGAHRPGIDLDSLGDPRLTAIRDAHAAEGRTLAILDLHADTDVCVVGAVAWNSADGTVLPTGHGCHLDPAIAISRAITELSQVTAVGSTGTSPSPAPTITQRPYLVPNAQPARRASELPDRSGDDIEEEIESCVRMLALLGHDVLVLDTTRPDIGLPAVRVVVPGLRPLLRRLAPGRLYDIPVQLGWQSRARHEAELNPDEFGR